MIYFTTKAYNAEATIGRTIESILSQTYGDFIYYLCDNGSLDGTGDIIREYAKKDKRIVSVFNEKNHVWTEENKNKIIHLKRNLQPDDWYSVLDADDDYMPDFLEELLYFATKEDLDYVACRSNFVKEPEGLSQNEFVLERDIVLEGKGFGTLFPEYFRFMGAEWGKIFRGSLFKRMDFKVYDAWIKNLQLSHRGDTAAMLYYLRFSQKAGVRAKLLHNYHCYPVSHSTQNLESKLRDNLKMPEIYREFLNVKVGYVSEENERYIQEVFERSQRRTLGQTYLSK